MRRGYTLLELLVVIAISAVVTLAVSSAYQIGVSYPARLQAARHSHEEHDRFEDQLSRLIRSAKLSTDASNPSSYFIGSTGLGENATSGAIATTIAFSAVGDKVPTELLTSQDDSATLNDLYGTLGGMLEVQLGTTPVGEAGARTGLFLREQRPSDGDPSQGGTESVLSDKVTAMSFEFWDGANWLPSWDTRSMTTPRLPASVRVTYRWDADEQDRILVVRLPLSDVTIDNPVATEGGTQP